MPRRSKKPFIDKKKSVTFQLVHRSQKDPLAADEDAPQRVLVPMEGQHPSENRNFEETPIEREERWSEQRIYGVQFDDDYNYMQHMRAPQDKEIAILVPKEDHRVSFDMQPMDGNEEVTEITREDDTILRLPSVVFGSTTEEKIGMLHRAIPPKGPQPSWDPDIVAGLEEDFNFEDPDNLLEDNFIIQASQPQHRTTPEEETDGESEDDFSSEFGDDDDESYFSEEETKSRFTSYSMTSSVMRRNENLSHLDDRFEKFFESYDDECIGDLAQVEIDGNIPVDELEQKQEIKMLLGIIEEKEEPEDMPEKEKCLLLHNAINQDDMVPIVKEVEKEKWDCESILSTYSTLYNHPRLIEEPKKIKISERTGMPVQEKRRLTKKQLAQLNEPEEPDESEETPAIHVRNKDESKEEKSLRKKAVKEARKERRQEKKATKQAFQTEKTRQNKEALNLRQNLSGLRIT